MELSGYSQYLELVAAVIGTLNYRKFKHEKLKYVLLLLWYVALNDFFAGISYPWFKIPNYIPYNIFYLVYFGFFIWWYSELIKSKLLRRIMLALLFIFVIFWLGNALFLDFTSNFLSYTYVLGTIFLTISIGLYLSEMLNTEEVVLNVSKSPYFWVAFGTLLFCVVYLPFELFQGFFEKNDPNLWTTVLFILNVIQYSCIALAFIVVEPDRVEHPVKPNTNFD